MCEINFSIFCTTICLFPFGVTGVVYFNVFRVLKSGRVSFILKQEGVYIFNFDLFVGLKIQLMQYEENDIKNPVHSLLFIISFSQIDLL